MKNFVIKNLLSNEEVNDILHFDYRHNWYRATSIDQLGKGMQIEGPRITEQKNFSYFECPSFHKILKKSNELFKKKLYTSESLSLLKYDSRLKAKFDWHKDTLNYYIDVDQQNKFIKDPEQLYIRNTRPKRNVSISVALNDVSEYNGGTLILDEAGDENEKNASVIRLNKGYAVLFDSDMYHGVHPVTEGTRYALIIWLYDLEQFYEWWEFNDEIPSEGWDRFKGYYEKHDIPL